MNSAVTFYIMIFLFLFLDVCSFALFEQPVINLLLCYYIITLLRPTPVLRQIILTVLVIFEGVIYYNNSLPIVLTIIPLTLIGIILRHLCYPSKIIRHLLLVATIGFQSVIIDPYFARMDFSLPYTLLKIFVNILVMILFGLKLR